MSETSAAVQQRQHQQQQHRHTSSSNSNKGPQQQQQSRSTNDDGGYTVEDLGSPNVDNETVSQQQTDPSVPLLHTLAQQGDLIKVKELLDKGEANATDVDQEGITALHWAAMNSALDICKLLLERGAEVDAIGGELLATPLHWATR